MQIQTLAIAIALLVPTSAFAVTPEYCDPSQDPDECACPSLFSDPNVDVCNQVSIPQLPTADNLSALGNAANVKTKWDSNRNAWEVEINLESMSSVGVFVIGEDNGTYENIAEFIEAMSSLLDEQVSAEVVDEDARVIFGPRIHGAQVGQSIRMVKDGANYYWAPQNSGDFIWDALSGPDGTLRIGETVFPPISNPGSCLGDDPQAYGTDTDGALNGQQCSVAKTVTEDLTNSPECQFDGSDPSEFTDCEFVPVPKISTRHWIAVDDSTSPFEGGVVNPARVRCVYDWNQTEQRFECRDPGMVTVTRGVADIQLDNYYFKAASLYDSDDGNPPVENITELERKSPGPQITPPYIPSTLGGFGVCGRGRSLRGGDVTPWIDTRDGDYDPNDPTCSSSGE